MNCNEQLLREIIGRRAPAVVQVRAGSGDVAFRVRLIKEGNHEGDCGLWAEMADGGNLAIDRLIASSSPILVTTQDGPRGLSFVSSLLARHKPLLGGNRVLLAWPGSIKTQERRRSEREPIPASKPVSAILLRGADGSFPPVSVAVNVVDLSVHGACLICPAPVSAGPGQGQDLELQLKLNGLEHRVAAQCRQTKALPTGHLRLRIEFNMDALPPGTATQLATLLEDLRSRRTLRELNGALIGGSRGPGF